MCSQNLFKAHQLHMSDKKSDKATFGCTDDGVLYRVMPGNGGPDCVVCGRLKNIDNPVRAGSLDSFTKKMDGSIAKLDKWTVRETGKGSSWLYIFPLDTCDNSECINTAYYEFQAAHKDNSLSSCQWQPSLHRCAICHTSVAELMLCARCKSVKYCSTICQQADWPPHKVGCYRKDLSHK